MTKHAMTSADCTKIIEALKNNPNAAAVARQFGFGETTILTPLQKRRDWITTPFNENRADSGGQIAQGQPKRISHGKAARHQS